MNYYFGVFCAKKSFIRVCDYLMHNECFCFSPFDFVPFFLPVSSFVCLLFYFARQFIFVSPHQCVCVCDTRFVLVPLLWCVQSDNNSFGSVHTSSSCYTYEIYLIIIDAELQSSLNRLIFRLVFISPSYFTLSAFTIHPSQSIIFNALHGSIGGLSCSLFFHFTTFSMIHFIFCHDWAQHQWIIYKREKIFLVFKVSCGWTILNVLFIAMKER